MVTSTASAEPPFAPRGEVPTAANAGYYAEIVREAILRRLVETGTRIAQLGYTQEVRSTRSSTVRSRGLRRHLRPHLEDYQSLKGPDADRVGRDPGHREPRW